MLASEQTILSDAFSSFSRASELLESSYRDLERQIAGLTTELGESRRERERQAEENRRLAERLGELVDALPGGVLVVDARGIVLECNPAARDLLGDPLVAEDWGEVCGRALHSATRLGGEFALPNGRRVSVAERALAATGGRIVHHLRMRLPDPKNTVLFVGYQAAGTRGQALTQGVEEVKMFGEMVPVKAEIRQIDALSAHADRSELVRWSGALGRPGPGRVFLTHGEPEAAESLAELLRQTYGWTVHVPNPLEKADLFA